MSRTTKKVELETNVYETAKQRIRFCYENYDDVICNFSGGKDSQLVVMLAREVTREIGIPKVKVVFYDQEFVYQETAELVDWLFAQDWVQGYRLCLPMEYELVTEAGDLRPFTLWDKGRKLFRDVPPNAILTDKPYSILQGERAVRDLIFTKPEDKSKRIAQLLGIRAEENITRLSTILASYRKGFQCFIRHSNNARGTDVATPIYDWTTTDVFFYLKENRHIMEINKMYFNEMIVGRPLRVDMPLGSAKSVNLTTIKEKNPKFYEMMLQVFPELDTTIRYAKSLAKFNDYNKMIEKYGLTLKGIRKLIDDTIPDEELKIFALSKYRKFLRDYIEFDRYTKFGYNKEEALKICFLALCKGNFGQNIMLRNKVLTKKELQQQNEKTT